MTVLCLVEHADGEVTDASRRALAFARQVAGSVAEGQAVTEGQAVAEGQAVTEGQAVAEGQAVTEGQAVAEGQAVTEGQAVAAGRAGAEGQAVAAAVFGPPGTGLAETLSGCGVSDVYAIQSSRLAGYAPQAWARALAGISAELPASAVVAAATDRGNEVLAHLGAITGLPMAADCMSAAAAGAGRWQLVRRRWAGSLLEDAVLEAPIALLTVAADTVAADTVAADTVAADTLAADTGAADTLAADTGAADTGAVGTVAAAPSQTPAAARVHRYEPSLSEDDLAVRATESAGPSAGVSLATARVVVGGGRGVGGPEGFGALEELAGLLGGVVGVSRVVTSEGWRPHKQQVGQTGTRISPELYLACGISGAIQHMAGCQGAKHIVVVNTDPEAPIISRADYAVIGDLNEVIPALVAAIRARTGSA